MTLFDPQFTSSGLFVLLPDRLSSSSYYLTDVSCHPRFATLYQSCLVQLTRASVSHHWLLLHVAPWLVALTWWFTSSIVSSSWSHTSPILFCVVVCSSCCFPLSSRNPLCDPCCQSGIWKIIINYSHLHLQISMVQWPRKYIWSAVDCSAERSSRIEKISTDCTI